MGRLAGVVALLVACGDNTIPPPDAGPSAGDVMVTTPQALVGVLVVQPDGTPGESALTDAQGNTTMHGVLPGAAITVVYPELNSSSHVASILGVAPGDHLVFGDSYDWPQTFPPPAGSMTVTMPLFPNTTEYDAWLCGDMSWWAQDPSIPVSLTTSCVDTTGPVVVLARDSEHNILASAYLPDASLVADTTLEFSAWTPNVSVVTSISGLSSEIGTVQLKNYAVYGSSASFDFSGYVTRDPTTAMMVDSLPGTAPLIVGEAEQDRDNGVVETLRGVPGTATQVKLAAPAMPEVTSFAVDPLVGRATWAVTAGEYDATVLTLAWAHFDASSGQHNHTWTVIVPPGMTSLDVTPALAATVPMTGDQFFDMSLVLVEVPSVVSYDALRALPEWQIVDPTQAVLSGDLTDADIAIVSTI